MSAKDVVMMVAAHDAFRRDLRHLVAAPSLERWRRFSEQLFMHHTAEDTTLWPMMRARGADPALLDAMEAEHGQIDPLLERISSAFTAKNIAEQTKHLTALSSLLNTHLEHEESKVLPLITQREWDSLDLEMRRRIGIRGIVSYFSWVLDEATPDSRSRVLAALPAPIRLAVKIRST
jgi:iron-sulfur cluster repair protein YtfE (RIC family)